jgi:hypothetical protein
MKDLKINELEDKYISHILNIDFEDKSLIDRFIILLNTKDISARYKLWQNFTIYLKNIKEVHKFSNPYYIGFGNPNSDILFVGKEKGFNIVDDPNLFLYESIDNILQWELIDKSTGSPIDYKFYPDSDFNPIFPRLHHHGKFSKRHTWGIYSQIISILKGLNHNSLINETRNYEDSLFKHSFMTEINFIPSKYSEGNVKISNGRKQFLSSDFFRSFRYVIIGAKGYLELADVENIFDAKVILTNKTISTVGKIKERSIKIDVFESANQKILLCSQLSGASGWSNEAIHNLVEELR